MKVIGTSFPCLRLQALVTKSLIMMAGKEKEHLYALMNRMMPLLCEFALEYMHHHSQSDRVDEDHEAEENPYPLYFLILYFALMDREMGAQFYWLMEVYYPPPASLRKQF